LIVAEPPLEVELVPLDPGVLELELLPPQAARPSKAAIVRAIARRRLVINLISLTR
jgi:hypothetical protein